MKPAVLACTAQRRPVGIVAATLSSDIAHAGGGIVGIASFVHIDYAATDVARLINGSHSGGDYAPYESYELSTPHSTDYYGVSFPGSHIFGQFDYQTGGDWYTDGGYWASQPSLQVWNGSSWVSASNQVFSTISAPGGTVTGSGYPDALADNGFQNFRVAFDAITGTQIRLYGAPGGAAGFIACMEIWVYEYV